MTSKTNPSQERSPRSLPDLVAEIERLTAELKEERGAAEDLLATLRKTEAERDRLAAELAFERTARPSEYRDHYREICDRLRAALERIEDLDDTQWREIVLAARVIAREALAGGAGREGAEHIHKWINLRNDNQSWWWACDCGERRQFPPPLHLQPEQK